MNSQKNLLLIINKILNLKKKITAFHPMTMMFLMRKQSFKKEGQIFMIETLGTKIDKKIKELREEFHREIL